MIATPPARSRNPAATSAAPQPPGVRGIHDSYFKTPRSDPEARPAPWNWAKWSAHQWSANVSNAAEITQNQLGWDITDFGSGDFERCGLILFTIRNGKSQLNRRPYAEKSQLVSRHVLSEATYDKIKDHVVAKQPKS